MITDDQLPPLPAPVNEVRFCGGGERYMEGTNGLPVFSMDQVRTIQREAYKAGMLKAAEIAAATEFEGQYCTPEDCKAAAEAIIAATKGE